MIDWRETINLSHRMPVGPGSLPKAFLARIDFVGANRQGHCSA